MRRGKGQREVMVEGNVRRQKEKDRKPVYLSCVVTSWCQVKGGQNSFLVLQNLLSIFSSYSYISGSKVFIIFFCTLAAYNFRNNTASIANWIQMWVFFSMKKATISLPFQPRTTLGPLRNQKTSPILSCSRILQFFANFEFREFAHVSHCCCILCFIIYDLKIDYFHSMNSHIAPDALEMFK